MTNAAELPATDPRTASTSNKKIWAGRIMSGLAVLFLLLDSVMKLLKLPVVVAGSIQLGYPESAVRGIGIVLLLCVVLYVIPRTAILGAILLTGYLGGAVATHVRVGSPLFSHILFPLYVAVLLWGGLFLRDVRVRAVLRA
jgi:DoxX-like family